MEAKLNEMLINGVAYVPKGSETAISKTPFNEIRKLSELIGMNVFIRTVTYHATGHVLAVFDGLIMLTNAAWIPDSGRFMNFIKEGKVNEVEPVGDCAIGFGAIIDIFPWIHKLPGEQR